MASGDWVGNIRIHSLTQQDIEEVKVIEAHDKEIISLAYSQAIGQDDSSLSKHLPVKPGTQRYWLASGSRDKLIMVFDGEHDYQAVSVLEHH